ncbi:MAG: PorT family protein [Prevotellaceae bacterium]|jgi:hypothetical protein|nr:PorT family protein [Prevotellaceae bacterium]
MNIKILVVLTAVLLSNSYIKAQTVNIGVRGGIAIPNIVAGNDNPLSKGYSSSFAGGGGIFTELKLNKKFLLRFGVEYSMQGGKRNGIQGMSTNQMITDVVTQMGQGVSEELLATISTVTQNFPPVFYADVKNRAKFDYLMIPVALQTDIFQRGQWKIYVNAGPFVSFLMSATQESEGFSQLYASEDKSRTVYQLIPEAVQPALEQALPALANVLKNGTEFGSSAITGEIRPVNVGVHGNIGVSYLYCNRHRFFVEVGGNYGLLRIQKNEANGSNRIGSAALMLGYAFSLTKN